MIRLPCPVCFVGTVGILPIANFDPEVQEHCDAFAALARHNRDPDDEYLVLACPVCNNEMEGSPLEVGLAEDEIEIYFELDDDDDDDEDEDDDEC